MMICLCVVTGLCVVTVVIGSVAHTSTRMGWQRKRTSMRDVASGVPK